MERLQPNEQSAPSDSGAMVRVGGIPSHSPAEASTPSSAEPLTEDWAEVPSFTRPPSSPLTPNAALSNAEPLLEEGLLETELLATTMARVVDGHQAQRLEGWQEALIARERARIAGELHDGITQLLANIRLRTQLVARLINTDPHWAKQEALHCGEQLAAAVQELRSIVQALRPSPLEQGGLRSGLHWLVDEFEGQSRTQIQFHWEAENDLPPLVETQLFRLAQEALNNVQKHAHASRVILRVRQDWGHITLEVADDGVGFCPEHLTTQGRCGLGLTQMQRRVEELGGVLCIESSPGEGTRIVACLPVKAS